ncbi:hypothetical protein [Streptomyces sp. L500]
MLLHNFCRGTAASMLRSLINGHVVRAVGSGILTVTVSADGCPVPAPARFSITPEGGSVEFDAGNAPVVLEVLAAAVASGAGGVVTRHIQAGGAAVRGWRLDYADLIPLDEATVFAAFCTDRTTGGPIPPEPGVTYEAGFDTRLHQHGHQDDDGQGGHLSSAPLPERSPSRERAIAWVTLRSLDAISRLGGWRTPREREELDREELRQLHLSYRSRIIGFGPSLPAILLSLEGGPAGWDLSSYRHHGRISWHNVHADIVKAGLSEVWETPYGVLWIDNG